MDDPGQLPPGVYMTEEGEILPINMPLDDEGAYKPLTQDRSNRTTHSVVSQRVSVGTAQRGEFRL